MLLIFASALTAIVLKELDELCAVVKIWNCAVVKIAYCHSSRALSCQ